MNNRPKIGTVVKLEFDGALNLSEFQHQFYLVEPGTDIGETILTPIQMDKARETIVLTDSVLEKLKSY